MQYGHLIHRVGSLTTTSRRPLSTTAKRAVKKNNLLILSHSLRAAKCRLLINVGEKWFFRRELNQRSLNGSEARRGSRIFLCRDGFIDYSSISFFREKTESPLIAKSWVKSKNGASLRHPRGAGFAAQTGNANYCLGMKLAKSEKSKWTASVHESVIIGHYGRASLT